MTLKTRIRLNQFIAQHGLCSRRKADDWIQAGRVTIDGIICLQVGTTVDPNSQRISVDGEVLQKPPERIYMVLNKPRGVVTTKNDPQGRKIVMDLLPPELTAYGIFPVGRLDLDSEGLLLLTNDGEWSRILLHPRQEVWKEYRVTTNQFLSQEIRQKLEQGVILDGIKTLPAKIREMKKLNSAQVSFFLAIREGRNRQIRRMCIALGLEVLKLERLSVGPVHLGDLKSGEWRHLKTEEVKEIFLLEKG